MMDRVFAYLRVQEKSYIAAKSGLFASIIFPLMMVFIFGSIMPSDYLSTILPGLIGFSILTDSLFGVTATASKYREMHIFRQLSLTPLRRSEWLISVFIWHLLIAAFSFTVIVVVGHFAYSVNITYNALILAYVIFGTLLFVSMGLLIGTIAKNVESASLWGNVVGFPMMLLSGTFFPVTMLPWYLQQAIKVLPLYYFVRGLEDAMVTGILEESALYLGILAALSAVFFIAGVYFFKWREK